MGLPATTGTAAVERDSRTAAASAIVMWRGRALPFDTVPDEIAAMSGRAERERLYGAWKEALEALNPTYGRRLEAWLAEAPRASTKDAQSLAEDLERFALHSETPYFAALRRYLALVGIEQGDATVADLWHVIRGTAWTHWFGDREIRRAVGAAGRDLADVGEVRGWREAEEMIAGPVADGGSVSADATRAAYATLAGSPEWLTRELGMAAGEVPAFADFAAFVRLGRLRHDIALLQYELRLFAGPADPALSRAYFAGIVGHMIGVEVAEEAYLHEIGAPYASARRLEVALLAGQLIEALESRHGTAWWRDGAAGELTSMVASASSTADALAQLGYDALDWRPVLRQIRTRLIGEMSGYGGPNITTRAGTRKV